MEFHRWQDSKSIDFNGWWQIEVLEDPSTVTLRNFNSGKYIHLPQDRVQLGCPFKLVDEAESAAVFKILPVNTSELDVNNFTESEIFKIQAWNTRPIGNSFITIESNEDSEALLFENSNFNIKQLFLTEPFKNNTFDAFKFIIPKEDEYMELSLCIDSREYIQSFALKLERSTNILDTLEVLKEGISKVFLKLLEFMQNKLKGKVRPEYKIGEIIPHRQEMIAKVGILKALFELLDLISYNFIEGEEDELIRVLEIDGEDFEGFEDMLEVIIKTVHTSAINNPTNVTMAIAHLHSIERFVFVEGCTSLLIDIFKDKNFELNKKEIHSELLYRRVFEIKRFEKVGMYFISRVREFRDPNSLLLLRKMCIIDGNPLPLMQDAILDHLYVGGNFPTRYIIKSDTNNSGLVVTDSFEQEDKPETLKVDEFMELADPKDKQFLIEQLCLEADL